MIVSCAGAFTQVPSDIEIRKILADRIGAENLGVGIVVGVIDSNGRRVVGYGSLVKNDRRHLDWRHGLRDWFDDLSGIFSNMPGITQ
jgi:hypothetical protein